MKTFTKGVLGAFALLLLSSASSFAIEGLHVSVQSTNAVLSWPSVDVQNYIVQYQPSLTSTGSWLTLTSSLPGDSGTNFTFYVLSNVVQYPPIISGGTNGGGSIDPNGTNSSSGGTTNFPSTAGFYRVVQDGVRLLDSSLLALTNLTSLGVDACHPRPKTIFLCQLSFSK
jgi:hypothetical protein